MLNIAICDDELQFLLFESSIIEEYLKSKGVEYKIKTYTNALEFKKSLSLVNSYDLVLLDVEMPELDGIMVAEEIRNHNSKCAIVFVSAHIKYSTIGYRLNACRYILKDINTIHNYIHECIDYVLRNIDTENRKLSFDFSIGQRQIRIDEIVYVESIKNDVQFFLKASDNKDVLRIRSTLKAIMERMALFDFVMINSKQAVNLSVVSDVYRYKLVTSTGDEFRISQKKYNDVYKSFMLYKGNHL